MSIQVKVESDVAIVSMEGKLMGGPETKSCTNKLEELINLGIRKVALDLSGVKWLNSGGIGMLMTAYHSLKKNGGDLRISGTNTKTDRMLSMTKLNTVFHCVRTVDQALSSFR